MEIFYTLTALVLLVISFVCDRKKTIRALNIAMKRFTVILPLFIIVILLTSLVLGFITQSVIRDVLGSKVNCWTATAISAAIGSIAVMPGFVAFPLGAILRDNGVLYMVISAFTTTLMMVGVLTFPIEQAFFGTKVAIFRNIIGFFTAIIVAIITGIAFGEVFN